MAVPETEQWQPCHPPEISTNTEEGELGAGETEFKEHPVPDKAEVLIILV